MNENQRRLLIKLQWFTIPFMILVVAFSIWPHFSTGNKVEAAESARQFFQWAELLILIPFLICVFVAYAFMREFFRKIKTDETNQAASADVLLKMKALGNKPAIFLVSLATLGFVVLMNLLLFKPQTILEDYQLEAVTLGEKCFFGFFYILCHFLLIVFIRQLFSNSYLFIATVKGFKYTPAGISSGWVFWEDIEEVREASVLFGNSVAGPTTVLVLGIKLRYPENYIQNYNPALQTLLTAAGQLNNYQTEGAGDLLLNPADFGNRYEEVKALIKMKSKS
jgi:hypothetical protein